MTNAGRALLILVLLIASWPAGLTAQGRGGPPQPPPTGRAGAHFDLTGDWVPIITEDWRFRMVTPPRGDYGGVPLSAEGRRVADAWDSAGDTGPEACRPYGAAGLMRLPVRLRISWADDQTVRIESDGGQQVRLLHFAADATPPGEPGWQGFSRARWDKQPQGRGFAGRIPTEGPGVLTVVTTNLRPGYLRWNGVPYSAQAVMTESFVRHDDFGEEWFTVITTVEDPVYLTRPFVTTTHFKREPDASKWNPTPCVVYPPL